MLRWRKGRVAPAQGRRHSPASAPAFGSRPFSLVCILQASPNPSLHPVAHPARMLQSLDLFNQTFAADLKALSNDQQQELIAKFWPEANYPAGSSYGAFIQYIGSELQHIHSHQRHYAVKDLGGLVNILQTLRENPTTPLADIVRNLSSTFLNAEASCIRLSVELTARLWLTVNIRSNAVVTGPIVAEEHPLEWEPTTSLEESLSQQYISGQDAGKKSPSYRIDPALTAANLASTCGMYTT